MTDPNTRPFHTIDPLILCTALAAQVPDIGFVATMSSTYNSPYNLARRTQGHRFGREADHQYRPVLQPERGG